MALIGWYPLDGNIEDYTVNQNHGVNNGVTWVDGKIGQAGSFNGTSSYITANYSQVQIKAFSLWIKVTSIPSTNQIIFVDSASGVGIGFYSGNSFILCSGLGQTNRQRRSDLSNFIVGEWNHIYVEYDELLIPTIYINKLEPNYLSNNAWSTSGNEFNIGRRSNGVYFLGELNDVRMYDHALSQKEINDLAKAKVLHYTFNKDEDIVYDSSGYKRNGTTSTIKPEWVTSSKLGSGGYKFNSTRKPLVVIPQSGTFMKSAMTVNIWAHLDDWNTPVAERIIGFATNWSGWCIGDYRAENTLFATYINGSYNVETGFKQLSPGWHMLSISFSGTELKYYVDGSQYGTTRTFSLGSEIVLRTDTWAVIGSHASASSDPDAIRSYHFNGIVDDVRFYSTALSASDILDLYQTRIKIDNHGNLYANEIVEDYEVKPGLTLRELFEDNNRFLNFDFSNALPNPLPSTIISDGYATQAYLTGQNHSNTTPLTTIETGRRYFIAFKYRPKDEFFDYLNLFLFNLAPPRSLGLGTYNASTFQIGKFREFSFYITANNVYDRIYFKNFATGINVGAGVDFDDIFFIPTTDIFGAGNEPSQAQMEIWYKDYITSRPKSSGIVKTREFSEIDSPEQPLKILKDKIQIQGSIKEV